MDELEGATVGREWLEGLAKPILAVRPPHQVEYQTDSFRTGEGGGVMSLWVNDKPRAMAVLHRDSANFTIVTMIDIDRIEKIEKAARDLWDAHNKSHDAIPLDGRHTPPKKWGMNYGELVKLAEVLGIVPVQPDKKAAER